ncbi:MAG: glycosyltransferase family 9 protein [Isosphaeraceae bacterium]
MGLADAREGSTWFYTSRRRTPRRLHAVDRVLKVAEALGVEDPEPEFQLPVGEPEPVPGPEEETLAGRLARGWCSAWGHDGSPSRWPRPPRVARRAATTLGAGRSPWDRPEDRPLVARFRECLGPLPVPVLDLCGRTTLIQLAAIARQSELFLSNDTGPLHLAAAAGAAVVGIYTCTDPRLTGPYGPTRDRPGAASECTSASGRPAPGWNASTSSR